MTPILSPITLDWSYMDILLQVWFRDKLIGDFSTFEIIKKYIFFNR